MKKNEVLIVIACEEESNGLIEKLGVNILYTNIGKVNASYYFTKKLIEMKQQNNLPKYVINIGSCGSKKFHRGQLVACNKFIQRDMDCGETPRDKNMYVVECKKYITDLEYGVCGTGDNFATKPCEIKEVDLCEMEAFALAKICKLENINFIAIKYITDGLNDGGLEDWNNNVKDSATSFYNYLNKILE